MAERIIRDASLRIKLSPDMKVRMERIAALYGAPPSTIAAVWLGQMLTQQENALGMVEKLASSMGSEVGEALQEAMRQQGLFSKSLPDPVEEV